MSKKIQKDWHHGKYTVTGTDMMPTYMNDEQSSYYLVLIQAASSLNTA